MNKTQFPNHHFPTRLFCPFPIQPLCSSYTQPSLCFWILLRSPLEHWHLLLSLLWIPCLCILAHFSFIKFRHSVQISLCSQNPVTLYSLPCFILLKEIISLGNALVYLFVWCVFLPFRLKLHVKRDFFCISNMTGAKYSNIMSHYQYQMSK